METLLIIILSYLSVLCRHGPTVQDGLLSERQSGTSARHNYRLVAHRPSLIVVATRGSKVVPRRLNGHTD